MSKKTTSDHKHSQHYLNIRCSLQSVQKKYLRLFSGLNDVDEVGTWRYTNGESPIYFNWPGGGPRTKRTVHRKNCVLVDKKRKMRNKICNSRKARLICEQDIGAMDPDRAPPKRDISSRSDRNGRRSRKYRDRGRREQLGRVTQSETR